MTLLNGIRRASVGFSGVAVAYCGLQLLGITSTQAQQQQRHQCDCIADEAGGYLCYLLWGDGYDCMQNPDYPCLPNPGNTNANGVCGLNI